MFKYKKFNLLVSLFMVGMLLLAACGAEEPTPAPVEEDIESEASSENQVPSTLSEVPRISVEELKERLDNGEAIVVADTTITTVYDLKHVAGAISVPFREVESHLDELPRDQEIVFYCSCPGEEESAGAALILYKNGYSKVAALLGGVAAWEAAGYPMEEQ